MQGPRKQDGRSGKYRLKMKVRLKNNVESNLNNVEMKKLVDNL